MNAPAVVDNGAAIYDLARETYLVRRFLPESALAHIAAVMDAFPGLSLELYHESALVQAVRPSAWNEKHALLTGLDFQVVEAVTPRQVVTPLTKALFISGREELERVHAFAAERGWAGDYELIFSSDHLLEMTAKGADKGRMALLLKELCGCRELICVGDHANDLPMLRAADRAFAPANAIEAVRSSGARLVCHCLDGALAEVVEALEE